MQSSEQPDKQFCEDRGLTYPVVFLYIITFTYEINHFDCKI